MNLLTGVLLLLLCVCVCVCESVNSVSVVFIVVNLLTVFFVVFAVCESISSVFVDPNMQKGRKNVGFKGTVVILKSVLSLTFCMFGSCFRMLEVAVSFVFFCCL